MRVYATELICSTGVLGFHTFKFALCIYNKLRSHAEILSGWAFDVTFPGSNPLRSNRSGLNVSNGGSWNPKFALKANSFWIKIKGQNFASQVLSRHTFKIPRKKGSDFFDHRGTLRDTWNTCKKIHLEVVIGHLQILLPLCQNKSFDVCKTIYVKMSSAKFKNLFSWVKLIWIREVLPWTHFKTKVQSNL